MTRVVLAALLCLLFATSASADTCDLSGYTGADVGATDAQLASAIAGAEAFGLSDCEIEPFLASSDSFKQLPVSMGDDGNDRTMFGKLQWAESTALRLPEYTSTTAAHPLGWTVKNVFGATVWTVRRDISWTYDGLNIKRWYSRDVVEIASWAAGWSYEGVLGTEDHYFRAPGVDGLFHNKGGLSTWRQYKMHFSCAGFFLCSKDNVFRLARIFYATGRWESPLGHLEAPAPLPGDDEGVAVPDGTVQPPAPTDSDGDGVIDANDSCPAVKGSAGANGCPDTDGDAIPDGDDRCVNTAGPQWNVGCPNVAKPAVIAEPDGRQHVYFAAANGQLQEWYFNGSGWTRRDWGYAGRIRGNPTAVKDSNGVINVFYRTVDDQLGRWTFNGSAWNGELLYGYQNQVSGYPTVVVGASGSVDVIYRNGNGQLGRWWLQGSDWNPTVYGYQAVVLGDPSPARGTDGAVDAFYSSVAGQMQLWWIHDPDWNNTQYGNENAMGGDPSAVRIADGSLNAFYKTSSGQLGRWTLSGAASNQGAYGYNNDVLGEPSAVAEPDGSANVYYRAANGQLGLWWIKGAGWNNTKWGYSGAVSADVAAVADPRGGDQIYYQLADGRLGHWRINGSAWSFETVG